jgi:hypothetical protein
VSVDGETNAPVTCCSLFPLSAHELYIYVWRAEKSDEPEVGILRDLKGMSSSQRKVIVENINQRRFLPEILDVTDIRSAHGMDEWNVVTDRGEKVFFVSNRKDSITVTEDNMLLITDVEKCRYRIPDYTALSARAYSLVGRALP